MITEFPLQKVVGPAALIQGVAFNIKLKDFETSFKTTKSGLLSSLKSFAFETLVPTSVLNFLNGVGKII